jgi:hypothetical protein
MMISNDKSKASRLGVSTALKNTKAFRTMLDFFVLRTVWLVTPNRGRDGHGLDNNVQCFCRRITVGHRYEHESVHESE